MANWYDYMQTGHAPIDAEHHQISTLLSELLDIINAGRNQELSAAFGRLASEVSSHFAHEERLMAESAYPLAQRHKQAHDVFLQDTAQAARELSEHGLTDRVRRWATGRLLEWFRLHISTNDVGLGRFLAAREANAAAGAQVTPPTR